VKNAKFCILHCVGCKNGATTQLNARRDSIPKDMIGRMLIFEATAGIIVFNRQFILWKVMGKLPLQCTKNRGFSVCF
jgi:hypothetical protein